MAKLYTSAFWSYGSWFKTWQRAKEDKKTKTAYYPKIELYKLKVISLKPRGRILYKIKESRRNDAKNLGPLILKQITEIESNKETSKKQNTILLNWLKIYYLKQLLCLKLLVKQVILNLQLLSFTDGGLRRKDRICST